MDKEKINALMREYNSLKHIGEIDKDRIRHYKKEKENYVLLYKKASIELEKQNNNDQSGFFKNECIRYACLIESCKRAEKKYNRFLFLKKELKKHTCLINDVAKDNNKKQVSKSENKGEQLKLF